MKNVLAMPATSSDLSHLVELFYAAASDPAECGAAWRGFCHYLGASSAVLFLEDAAIPSRRLFAAYGCHEPALAALDAGFELSDAALLPAYEVFARARFGVEHVILGSIALRHGRRLRVACHRGGESAGFTEREQMRLMEILPHVAGALRLQKRLENERKLATAPATILENIICGTILLAHDGQLLHINRPGRALTADAGLALVGVPRGLEAQLPCENQRLQSLLQDVRSGGDGGVLLVTRSPPLCPLAVWVRRLPRDEDPAPHRPLILMRELASRPAWRAPLVKDLFGLTQAESEVVEELLGGLTARAVAQKRNVSLYTVQAQVRHILAKTGAEKMRDVVRMMAALFG